MGRVLVALSGGVDSSVAVLLLKQRGHDVSVVYMRTWMDEGDQIFDCKWQEDVRYARATAELLGVPFKILNMIDVYRERVVKYLVDGYASGLTPNPDIRCNSEVKFGVLADYALENGFDALATGHYCVSQNNADGSVDLFEGVDKNKDQSYFLCRLRQDQLQRAIFPVGRLTKQHVRQLAQEHQLPAATRKDSQGICFLGKVPIQTFLKRYIGDKPGSIITRDGKFLGEHKGLHYFTIGQRKGMGIPSNTDHENYIVVGKNIERNELIVAFASDANSGVDVKSIRVEALTYTNAILPQQASLLAKPRYRDPSQPIILTRAGEHAAVIDFEQPQRALAPGQILALYEATKLIGSGVYI